MGQVEKLLIGVPLSVEFWNGMHVAGTEDARVKLSVRSPSAMTALVKPTLGRLARAYVDSLIDVQGSARDLIGVGAALCRTDACRDAKHSSALSWWRHTRSRDRRNIQYHYDVSNDFYGLWLDPRRVYSCAYFRNETDTLDAAQEAKLDLICRKLMLAPGERFLDIGCGWGGLILWAAEHYGVHATGITLSENQAEYVNMEVARRGLSDRVDVRLMDYRDVPEDEQFDRIASVGMFEHVGRAKLDAYFAKIFRLLRPGGLVMNHGITAVSLTGSGLGSGISEFIDDYVFPGGELVHASRVIESASKTGLEVVDLENLRPHYARTLWSWVDRLDARAAHARELIGERRLRIWRIYMAGSAFAFERNWLALFQVLAGKPLPDGRLAYPFRRDHVYA
jgi:cyclopropane-fatty-acyl-phospholipid synthase